MRWSIGCETARWGPSQRQACGWRSLPRSSRGGLSNREIADKLVLSNATVKTHINRIFYKTGARDRAQAVRYAYQHGLA